MEKEHADKMWKEKVEPYLDKLTKEDMLKLMSDYGLDISCQNEIKLVEIVKCKDCIYRKRCSIRIGDDFWCADGERKYSNN